MHVRRDAEFEEALGPLMLWPVMLWPVLGWGC